jgi:hypothetical protein
MRFSAILSGPYPVSALQRWVIANSRHGSICAVYFLFFYITHLLANGAEK